jgi:glycosyltransferase involved in cell wall biosynthesis
MSSNEHKKKVLIAITQSNYGGAQKYVYDLARSLPRKQYDVTVVFGEGGILGKMLAAEGIRTISLNSLVRHMSIMSEIKTFFAFYRLLRRERPDILHSNSSKMGGIGAVVGRVAGVPRVIFTCHGWAFNEARPLVQRSLIYLFSWFIVFFSHTTIFVSEVVCRQMRYVPFLSRKSVVINNGISPTNFHSRSEARDIIIARSTSLKSDTDTLWVGMVAELHPVKNHDVVIRAWVKVIEKFPTARFIALGEGHERERLEKLIRGLHIEHSFFLPGHITKAVTLMKAFDIFCLPSRSESFGQVILEAGSAGLPVIASRVGGIPELITDDSMGILIPAGDVNALAAALITLLNDEQKRRNLGTALKEQIEKTFSLATMVQKTVEVYGT